MMIIKITEFENDHSNEQTVSSALKLKSKSEMAMSNFSQAVITLRFVLEISFRLADVQSEIKVYEKMALCYFYMSDLTRCQYYLTKR
jgi:hypothetical protein